MTSADYPGVHSQELFQLKSYLVCNIFGFAGLSALKMIVVIAAAMIGLFSIG